MRNVYIGIACLCLGTFTPHNHAFDQNQNINHTQHNNVNIPPINNIIQNNDEHVNQHNQQPQGTPISFVTGNTSQQNPVPQGDFRIYDYSPQMPQGSFGTGNYANQPQPINSYIPSANHAIPDHNERVSQYNQAPQSPPVSCASGSTIPQSPVPQGSFRIYDYLHQMPQDYVGTANYADQSQPMNSYIPSVNHAIPGYSERVNQYNQAPQSAPVSYASGSTIPQSSVPQSNFRIYDYSPQMPQGHAGTGNYAHQAQPMNSYIPSINHEIPDRNERVNQYNQGLQNPPGSFASSNIGQQSTISTGGFGAYNYMNQPPQNNLGYASVAMMHDNTAYQNNIPAGNVGTRNYISQPSRGNTGYTSYSMMYGMHGNTAQQSFSPESNLGSQTNNAALHHGLQSSESSIIGLNETVRAITKKNRELEYQQASLKDDEAEKHIQNSIDANVRVVPKSGGITYRCRICFHNDNDYLNMQDHIKINHKPDICFWCTLCEEEGTQFKNASRARVAVHVMNTHLYQSDKHVDAILTHQPSSSNASRTTPVPEENNVSVESQGSQSNTNACTEPSEPSHLERVSLQSRSRSRYKTDPKRLNQDHSQAYIIHPKKDLIDIKDYYKKQDGAGAFQCLKCSQFISKKYTLERHIVAEHVKDRDHLYQCSECGFAHSYVDKINKHFRNKITEKKKMRDNNQYEQAERFIQKPTCKDEDIEAYLRKDTSSRARRYVCIQCNEEQSELQKMIVHIKRHHLSKLGRDSYWKYSCTRCEYKDLDYCKVLHHAIRHAQDNNVSISQSHAQQEVLDDDNDNDDDDKISATQEPSNKRHKPNNDDTEEEQDVIVTGSRDSERQDSSSVDEHRKQGKGKEKLHDASTDIDYDEAE